jgi:L,D-transpeptidase ErfK/SrfK
VSLYQKGSSVGQYSVAIGQAGWETPTGTFRVVEMHTDPEWEHPITGEVVPAGADNPLGTRWIGFWSDGTNQIGFHGTNQAHSIGQAVSHGCIRMLNTDIEALYQQVKMGTPVVVYP